MEIYRQKLMSIVYHTGQPMRPLFMQAKSAPKRVIYADGEDERVLRAAQTVVDDKIDNPILLGRTPVIDLRIRKFGLRLAPHPDLANVNPADATRSTTIMTAYYQTHCTHATTPQ